MKKNKKIISLDDFLNKHPEIPTTNKDIYAQKYKKSIDSARATDSDTDLINKLNLKSGYYSMRTRILKNPWVNNRPASQATKWLFQTVFKDPSTFKYGKLLMYQGGLFMFKYLNPKYKGTSVLPWFDKYPLVISLGPVVTNKGVRNIGFNLHLLPPKIRIVVISRIFELYKRLYRYQIFFKQEKPVKIHYKEIIKALDKYGVRFCVRMYIPSRMNQIVFFPLKTWHKAIFIPSRGYDGIKAAKLISEWRKFNKKQGYSSNENINWKSLI